MGAIGGLGAVGLGMLLAISSLSSLGGVEIGPGQGTRSERLAVEVRPRTGLDDGDTVFVTSEAFAADSVVGVATCLDEAATEHGGVEACDEAHGTRFAVDRRGRLSAAVAISRVITVDGRAHDCATTRCLVVAADANDYDISGGRPITFASGLPAVDLTPRGEPRRTGRLPATVRPPGPVEVGATVTVTASGLVPGEPVLVALCTDDLPRVEPGEACKPLDETAALSALFLRSVEDVEDRADSDGRYRAEVEVPRLVRPYSTDRPVRCASARGRCGVVIAAAADVRRSSFSPLTLAR